VNAEAASEQQILSEDDSQKCKSNGNDKSTNDSKATAGG